MSKAISERHEIVVETDESTFILTADSRDGRLVIEQRRKRGAGKGEEVSRGGGRSAPALSGGRIDRGDRARAQSLAKGNSNAPRAARRRPTLGRVTHPIARPACKGDSPKCLAPGVSIELTGQFNSLTQIGLTPRFREDGPPESSVSKEVDKRWQLFDGGSNQSRNADL